MIPRLKPYLGKEELLAALTPDRGAVERFEIDFARTFEAKYALAFSYGRSALWAFFKAMGIHDAEIIMPAYTCVVVAHAIVLSGNKPRFVDVSLYDYNMELDQVAEAINAKTGAVIATHLFGYPLDIDRLSEIVQNAENRLGKKIWILQDCAHSFGAEWKGKLVCNAGDVALFGLNISKMMTSIFGGIITTNDEQIYEKLRIFRDTYFKKPGFIKTLRRLIYLMAVYPAFNEQIYGVVYWLQEKTTFLDWLTKAYHLDEKIHFPPDYLDRMLPIEARVGIVQLKKYPEIIKKRRETAIYYDQNISTSDGWVKPPIVEGATYSHYVVRVPDRQKVMQAMANRGVQLGQLIEYSVPHLPVYKEYANNTEYPVSKWCSRNVMNLPIHCFFNNLEKRHISSIAINNKSIKGNEH